MNPKKLTLLVFACTLFIIGKIYAGHNYPPGTNSVTRVITGTITDSKTKEPLNGVSVVVKGTTQGTATDASGKFSLNAPDADVILVLSYTGFLLEEIKVSAKTNTLDHTLNRVGNNSLDEVVVVGYGTQRKGDVTSAVASVKSEQFVKGYVRDAGQLIQGKVAGLTISTSSGDPQGNSQIQLRGASSIKAGTSPLVLIDGVPGNLNSVAPQDIESVDVLKDGSAAAIYGTRGTNGVILITTRKMHGEGRTTVTYDSYVSTQTIYKKPEFLNAADVRQLITEGVPYVDYKTNTDWFKEITHTPVSHNHNLTLQGGTRTTNYTASLNYADLNGIFLKSGQKTVTGRFDINQTALDGKVRFNFNASTAQMRNVGGFNSYIYRQSVIRNPTDSVRDYKGDWLERNIYFYDNPVAYLMESSGENKNQETRINGSVVVTPIKGLNLKLLVASVRQQYTSGYAETKKHVSNTKNGRNGVASLSESNSQDRLLEYTMDYNRSFGQHKFTVLGGYSYQDFKNDAFDMSNYDFPTDQVSWNNMALGNALTYSPGNATMRSSASESKLIGFFGRVNYNFADKYMLMASIRREGSSKFGENYKWGNFPGVSVGWRIKKENFMDNVFFVNDLKLRVGYGVTGISPSAPYESLTRLDYNAGRFLNNGVWIQGLRPSRNPNPDLRWETKKEYNLGLDFTLFKNRVSGSLDLYKRRSEDLLYDYAVPTPPYLFSSILANAATIENKGVEVLVNYNAVQKKDFEWTTSVNFSTNSNKLVSLSSDQFGSTVKFFTAGGTGEPVQDFTHRVDVGGPIGNFYSYKSVDVDANGKWLIQGLDGKPKEIALAKTEDKQILGNGLPKYYAGWNNTVRYKNFDLSVLIRGAFGYQILNFQRMYYENPTVTVNYNVLKSAFDKVYGKARLTSPQAYVSYYIENGDHVKIDNVTLGYNVPVKNKYVKSLRAFVSGLNLLVITGYKGIDPEVTRSGFTPGNDERDKYPTTRIFTFGLNVVF